jgi:glycine oxidase
VDEQRFDAIVVGGGAIGLACAWAAARRGLRVCVLERDRIGAGATWAAAGMLAPATEAEFGEDELLRLNLASAERWPGFAAALGDVGYERSGTLYAALDRDELEALERLRALQSSLGLETEWLSGRDCRRLEPGLTPHAAGGLRAGDEAQVDPRRLVTALAAAVEDAGGAIRTGVEVVEVDAGGAATADGCAFEGAVVVAAGCWTGSLVEAPIRPVKGQILRLRGERPCTHSLRTDRVYVVSRPSGETVVGATVEERGFDTTVTAGAVHELLREAYRALPEIAELELAEAFAGLRPGTPDNRPRIGRLAEGGPIVASGHYRNGILLAPVTGDAVAALLLGEQPDVDLAPFSPALAEAVAP